MGTVNLVIKVGIPLLQRQNKFFESTPWNRSSENLKKAVQEIIEASIQDKGMNVQGTIENTDLEILLSRSMYPRVFGMHSGIMVSIPLAWMKMTWWLKKRTIKHK